MLKIINKKSVINEKDRNIYKYLYERYNTDRII